MQLPNRTIWETIGVVAATCSDLTVPFTTPTQLETVALRDTLQSEACGATALRA